MKYQQLFQEYGTMEQHSGSHPTNTGTIATSYTPNFVAPGTYYVVCVSTFTCGTVTSNEVEINVSGTITTGTITGSPFCVTASSGSSVFQVPFTSLGTFGGGNIFTAQLSDPSGGFGSPQNIGTGNSSPISATILANTPTGTGYRIRVISSDPAIISTDNGTDLTINLPEISIAPTGVQNINAGVNGTMLVVTEAPVANSREWFYGIDGINFDTPTGVTATSYIPNFAVQNTYYVVCKSTFDCGTITSNAVQVIVSATVTTGPIAGSPFCVRAALVQPYLYPLQVKDCSVVGIYILLSCQISQVIFQDKILETYPVVPIQELSLQIFLQIHLQEHFTE